MKSKRSKSQYNHKLKRLKRRRKSSHRPLKLSRRRHKKTRLKLKKRLSRWNQKMKFKAHKFNMSSNKMRKRNLSTLR